MNPRAMGQGPTRSKIELHHDKEHKASNYASLRCVPPPKRDADPEAVECLPLEGVLLLCGYTESTAFCLDQNRDPGFHPLRYFACDHDVFTSSRLFLCLYVWVLSWCNGPESLKLKHSFLTNVTRVVAHALRFAGELQGNLRVRNHTPLAQ